MSDDQWLSAIAHYKNDQTFGLSSKGGASQLAEVLREATNAQPRRFLNLLLEFPQDTNLSYPGAVLNGLAMTKVSADDLARAISFVHSWPNCPFEEQHIATCFQFIRSEVPKPGMLEFPGM